MNTPEPETWLGNIQRAAEQSRKPLAPCQCFFCLALRVGNAAYATGNLCGGIPPEDVVRLADAVIRELEADYILVPRSHTTLARKSNFRYGEHYGI